MKNKIIQGDVLEVLKTLPSKSINMLMTSPPYWALRDYGSDVETIWDGKEDCEHKFPTLAGSLRFKVPDDFCINCGAWKGQLGLEPTFDLYIKHLCDIFDEVKRVLRDDGTIWVNLGDCYAGNMGKKSGWTDNKLGFEKQEAIDKGVTLTKKTKIIHQLPQKCLVCIPDRFKIEMLNRGWILRNKIIWWKPNCMPSSAKDRFTIDFEELLLFTKSKQYYFKQQCEDTKAKVIEPRMKKEKREVYSAKYEDGQGVKRTMSRNMRSVWSINPQPFRDYYCMNCGHFAKPKSIKEKKGYFGGEKKQKRVCEVCGKKLIKSHFAIYPEELCETPIKAGCPKDGIVLDPFFGAGTTGLVALKQNKKFIGIELNKEYIKIANARIKPFLEQSKLN